ncbi:helix-turn-helix domain-containing protein [Paenibacillus sp. NFR01]|uniref:helix-turn-helix domain-containing protein n=1 Tax=Paenibacillus sp. NFR01 TaxID=1566279 RepID=UPI0008B5CEF2|nr:helix-turn-helix domain-containing protein [Paenibacillus sp. NFR01]SET45247.1 AraC-type DNA-binding protein [Paenibacillus sp. NFR01]
MKLKDLHFHIHYCNGKKYRNSAVRPGKISRTLQHHELVFVDGGSGSLMIGGKIFPVKEGMLYYIPAGVPHIFDKEFGAANNFLTVHFSYARVVYGETSWQLLETREPLLFPPAEELKDYYQISEAFSRLVECWNAKMPGYEFLSRTLLQQLLAAIYQNLRKRNRNYATSLKVEKIIGYMQQHVDGRVTLTELSELVQLSPAYVSRAFKEATGESATAFFNRMKIDRAKEMLLEGGQRVKEVARALGFSDEFYFSRLFKQTEGISPTEFQSKNVHGV